MRTASLLVLTFAACSFMAPATVHAATNWDATYVVGNLDNLEPGAEGILQLDAAGLTFHSGKVTLGLPYATIGGAELGAKLTRSSDVPLYKVWELHKRLGGKPVFQNLTVTFRDPNGKEQTITFELTEATAAEIRDTIDLRTGRKARRQQEEWWGDTLWRTDRNRQGWDQTAALGSR